MGGDITQGVGPSRPMLVAVDTNPLRLDRIEGELTRCFGSDFRIRGELNAAAALDVLDTARDIGQRVAVVLVDLAVPAEDRAKLFDRARAEHPDARRAMLVEWGAWADRDAASAILQAMT
ncbi:MAG: hypothetical protein ACRDVZ_14405, partial [Jiangellaceae bacterium]